MFATGARDLLRTAFGNYDPGKEYPTDEEREDAPSSSRVRGCSRDYLFPRFAAPLAKLTWRLIALFATGEAGAVAASEHFGQASQHLLHERAQPGKEEGS